MAKNVVFHVAKSVELCGQACREPCAQDYGERALVETVMSHLSKCVNHVAQSVTSQMANSVVNHVANSIVTSLIAAMRLSLSPVILSATINSAASQIA